MFVSENGALNPHDQKCLQYYSTGVGDEMAIAKALEKNTSLCKFSLNWKNGGSRNTADRFIMRNNDLARKKRRGLA